VYRVSLSVTQLAYVNWKFGQSQCQDSGVRTTDYIQLTKLETRGSNLPVAFSRTCRKS